MCLDSVGESPSQMIAVWFARFARCRSRQLAETLRVPSWNQRICTSPEKLTSFTLVKGLIQSMRLPYSPQKPSGSLIERAYHASYFAASTQERATIGEGGWNTWPCGITFLPDRGCATGS